jgi:hypothetical protein
MKKSKMLNDPKTKILVRRSALLSAKDDPVRRVPGYSLYLDRYGCLHAGCRGPWTRATALKHWKWRGAGCLATTARARARAFVKAIEALPPQTRWQKFVTWFHAFGSYVPPPLPYDC